MPFARLTVADEHLPAATRTALAEGITALLASDLRKARETTVLEVSLVPAQSWFVARRQHPGTTGAHLEVGITVGSNSAEERSRFIADAYAFLAETLDAGCRTPAAGHWVVREVRSAARTGPRSEPRWC